MTLFTFSVAVAEPEAPATPEKSPPPKKPGEGYSAPKPKVTYKPYTLKDYGAMKRSFGYRAGGLGPDTENSAYKSKVSSHVTSYLIQVTSRSPSHWARRRLCLCPNSSTCQLLQQFCFLHVTLYSVRENWIVKIPFTDLPYCWLLSIGFKSVNEISYCVWLIVF